MRRLFLLLMLPLLMAPDCERKKCSTSEDCTSGQKCYVSSGRGVIPAGQWCAFPGMVGGMAAVVASVDDFPKSCDFPEECAKGNHLPADEVPGRWSQWRVDCRIRAWTKKCPRCGSNYGDHWEDDPKGCSGIIDTE